MNAPQEIDKLEHARANARGWAETISGLVAALECDYGRLEALRDERESLEWDVKHADAETEGEAEAAEALANWDAENGEEFKELTEAATVDGEPFKDADEVRERIQEGPLSVELRSGWVSSRDEMKPEEFAILLSTGGPALRIRGELDEHCQPCRAWLEMQDWFIPWTEFHGEGAPSQDDLVTYASQFYFGD